MFSIFRSFSAEFTGLVHREIQRAAGCRARNCSTLC